MKHYLLRENLSSNCSLASIIPPAFKDRGGTLQGGLTSTMSYSVCRSHNGNPIQSAQWNYFVDLSGPPIGLINFYTFTCTGSICYVLVTRSVAE